MEVTKLALLGRNISHSLSPALYKEIYQEKAIDYRLIDIDKEIDLMPLTDLMQDLDGLNITSPFKEYYLPEVEINSEEIQALAAINCIGKVGGKFYATNTDYLALLKLMPKMPNTNKVIILGDGVMSRVVSAVCRKLKIHFMVRSRKICPDEFKHFSAGNIVDKNSLIINCCSRSYSFKGNMDPSSHFWDLNYRHSEHLEYFKNSPSYTDGYSLLKLQAYDAAAFWSQLKN